MTGEIKTLPVFGSIRDNGDGSASIHWFLSYGDAREDNIAEWGEECVEKAETFVGSNIYNEAIRNSARVNAELNPEFVNQLNKLMSNEDRRLSFDSVDDFLASL